MIQMNRNPKIWEFVLYICSCYYITSVLLEYDNKNRLQRMQFCTQATIVAIRRETSDTKVKRIFGKK